MENMIFETSAKRFLSFLKYILGYLGNREYELSVVEFQQHVFRKVFFEELEPPLIGRLLDILSSPALPTSCGSQLGHRYQLLHVADPRQWVADPRQWEKGRIDLLIAFYTELQER